MRTEILVPNVDVHLLRKQRESLENVVSTYNSYADAALIENFTGLIYMLDAMIDIAEGHAIKKPG